MSNPIVRRTRRSDTNPVLRLAFPEGTNEADVTTALKNYGMESYKVTQEEGIYMATRADLKSISKDGTQDIKLDGGLTATVVRQDTGASNPEDKPNITLAALEFDSSKFTSEDVQRWVAEKCVDGDVQQPQNPDECYVVRRSDVADNEETRRMVLEDGVTAVIVRSDVSNVPDGFVAVVNEAAYGSWGWGQLDFMSAMADVEFSDVMDRSMRRLWDVLYTIIMYSGLPLDIRKDLVNRALGQYGAYVGTIMDSLPRQLLVSVVRSANPTLEKTMTQASKGGAAPTPEAVGLTREDVQKMITESVGATVTAAVAEALKSVQRSEPAPAAEPKPAAEPAKEPEVKGLSRADVSEAIGEALKPITEQMAKIAGATVVRSSEEPEPAAAEPKKKGDDVFRGAPVFAGLRRGQVSTAKQ